MHFFSVLTILIHSILSGNSKIPDGIHLSGSLTVKISNIKELKGNMMVAIYKGDKGFRDPKHVHIYKIIPVNHSKTEVKFENVSAGEYAIAVYQDLNKNNNLDLGWFGIPSEPYGFSNNPVILMGPPSFKDAKFHYGESEKQISVVLN
jgi:uncharacterized protein (DUF2141 family)